MSNVFQASMALVFAASTVACTGTDVGNPVDVDFTLYNQTFDPSAARPVRKPGEPGGGARLGPGAIVSLTRGWLAVERIRVRDAATCQGNAEIEVVGPFAVDLLLPGVLPELSGIDMPASGYCRFEVRWDRYDEVLPATAPPALAGATMVLEGTRGDGTPFLLRSERDDELRLDAIDGAFTVDDATHALFMAFDAKALFAGVDLDAAVVDDTTGVIVIDKGQNDELLTVFDANLRAAAELFDDDDNDRELDPDERDVQDILAE